MTYNNKISNNRFDELESFLDKHENDFLAVINYSRVALLYKTKKRALLSFL